jgi:PAS domain S-box-containing protein
MPRAHGLREAAAEFRAEAARRSDARTEAELLQLAGHLEELAELREIQASLQSTRMGTEAVEAPDPARDAGDRSFKELADFAPVMIWRSGPDALCNWFNKPWLDFVGRSMDQEIGNGWAENVHPDDFDRCLEIYLSSFSARKPFTMSYRLKRHDGVYREILDNGDAFYRNGVFAGYFGSCIDVVDLAARLDSTRVKRSKQSNR